MAFGIGKRGLTAFGVNEPQALLSAVLYGIIAAASAMWVQHRKLQEVRCVITAEPPAWTDNRRIHPATVEPLRYQSETLRDQHFVQ